MADHVVKYVFKGDIKGLTTSMKAAGASVGKLADDLTKADKDSAKFRKGLTTVGDTAGKVGLVAAAGLGAVVVAAANFDKAMSEVQAATGESAENMEKLRQAAIQAGADTAFSASEAADGITQLAKAGVSTADILSGGLSGALDLAAAGQIAVGDAAEYTATALTQFQLSGDKASHVADLLAAGAGLAQGEVADMANALKYAGVPAANLGVSIEQTAGTIALFAKNGIIGEQAGTSLRGMFASLTSPSAVAAKEMDKLGISVFDATGNFIGLDGVAEQLHDRLGPLTQAERANALGRIFGNEQLQAANVLYREGGKAVREWTGNVDAAGFAAAQAAAKMDNLAGDVEQLKGSLETALIGAGEGAQGPLRSWTQNLTNMVNLFNDLPGPIKNVTTGMLGITAILGGGLWFTSKTVGAVTSMRTAMVELGIAADGAKLSVAGVARSAGLLAGLTFTAIGTLDMMDSARRTREAADATAASFGDLFDTLSESNVGKYASDLGIDLDRLATDLATYGADGEYVAEVHQMLQDSGHGVGPMFKALSGTIIPGYTNSTEKASDALTDFNNILENNKRVTEASADAGHAILSPFRALDGVLQVVNDSSRGTADGIGVLGREIQTTTAEAQTLENAMKSLFGALDADAALDAWRESIQGLTKELKGGEGALDGMTKKGRANKEEIRSSLNLLRERAQTQYEENGNLKQLERNLLRGRDAIIKQAKAAGIGDKAIRGYLKHLKLTPKEIRTEINLMRAPEAQAKLQEIQDAADELNRTRPLVHVDADASEALRKIAAVNYARIEDKSFTITTYYDAVTRDSAMVKSRPPIQKAAGGRVSGPGTATSDSIPAYLSNGEYVVKAAAVDKYGVKHFDNLNAMRYAEGGAVRAQRAESYSSSSSSVVNNYGGGIGDRLQLVVNGRAFDAYVAAVADDRYGANRRQDHATGRRR